MRRTIPYRYGVILLMAALALPACQEVIDIELDTTYRRLVVFGTVTTDSLHHQVRLSTTSDYFSNQPAPAVSDALVELKMGETVLRLEELDSVPGLYQTPVAFRGKPLTRYHLHISQVDVDNDGIFESYEAETTMPVTPMLDSIRLVYFQTPFFSGYQVFMFAMDSPEREWYGFKIWKNSDLLTDELSDYRVQSDDFVNGKYIYGLPVGFLTDSDPRQTLLPGDTVTLELNSIGEDFFDFISDAQLEIMGNNPLFSGPSANVHSNIGNNGIGIFTAYSLRSVSVIVRP
ncbi:MAG TPA: DUF4249 domain-containing protein [Bacteroides sp.]|nr:DUF4249 domain-containing protein [Bacteroides sp.]